MDAFTIFSGSANPALAEALAQLLGVPLGACQVARFPDGEVEVEIGEPVRRKEVFIVQPTAPPVNDHLIELLACADACRRAGARQITAVVPYFGYGRADKRHRGGDPITARMVADLLQSVGIGHIVTVDLHAAQIEGFFHIPVDSLTAIAPLSAAVHEQMGPRTVVVSPDEGRVQMATEYARLLGSQVIVLHKQRVSGTTTAVTHVVGDVYDRPCLIVDDMISTGGTLAGSIRALLEAGALPDLTIAATHGLLLPGAREQLSHPAVRAVYVTDTVALPGPGWAGLHRVSVAPLLAAALRGLLGDSRAGAD